jgi:hypothetical protein
MSHTRSRQSLTETQYPNQNWSQFRVGEDVEVQYPDGHVEKATVDAKSPDSKIVWLLSHAGQGRKMYGDWEGISLTPHAREHGQL